MSMTARSGMRAQSGLSLVELMVGIAVGLFIVAGATMVVSTQLGDNRRLLLETQLQQDLRATLDILTRELRRAGRTADAATLTRVWHPDLGSVAVNPLAVIGPIDGGVTFRYRRDGNEGPYGFRLQDGRIQSLLGGGWQELTDSSVMNVTALGIVPNASSQPLPCPRACPDGTEDCWPQAQVRTYTVDITAASKSDPAVQRSMRSTVRVRNDALDALCPA